jgi:hypothetical protein
MLLHLYDLLVIPNDIQIIVLPLHFQLIVARWNEHANTDGSTEYGFFQRGESLRPAIGCLHLYGPYRILVNLQCVMIDLYRRSLHTVCNLYSS